MVARASALVDERRLFYVAITRARRRLMVTAVSGGGDAELRPSRFLGELGIEVPAQAETAPRLLSQSALVAELRCVAGDESASPALREAAAAELAALVPEVAGRRPGPLVGARRVDRARPAAAARRCSGDAFAEPG